MQRKNFEATFNMHAQKRANFVLQDLHDQMWLDKDQSTTMRYRCFPQISGRARDSQSTTTRISVSARWEATIRYSGLYTRSQGVRYIRARTLGSNHSLQRPVHTESKSQKNLCPHAGKQPFATAACTQKFVVRMISPNDKSDVLVVARVLHIPNV